MCLTLAEPRSSVAEAAPLLRRELSPPSRVHIVQHILALAEHRIRMQCHNLDILLDIREESAMSTAPQKRALNRYRKRLGQRGMARFEVLGLDADRELIRSLAKRLAGNGPDSARIRDTVRLTISGEQSKKGGILNALRRSPLVGADLDLNRPLTPGRRVDL